MTQEEKELLLKDLCARLPYGVMVQTPELPFCMGSFISDPIGNLHMNLLIGGSNICISYKNEKNNNVTCSLDWCLWELRPFLRPIDSMTEEEKKELWKAIDKDTDIIMANLDAPIISIYKGRAYRGELTHYERDFLISHHFDCNGLIPMGLALPAKEGMYN